MQVLWPITTHCKTSLSHSASPTEGPPSLSHTSWDTSLGPQEKAYITFGGSVYDKVLPQPKRSLPLCNPYPQVSSHPSGATVPSVLGAPVGGPCCSLLLSRAGVRPVSSAPAVSERPLICSSQGFSLYRGAWLQSPLAPTSVLVPVGKGAVLLSHKTTGLSPQGTRTEQASSDLNSRSDGLGQALVWPASATCVGMVLQAGVWVASGTSS